MADFNVNLASPQGAGAQALSPISRPSSAKASIAPLVDFAVGMGSLFLKNKEEQKKTDAAAKQQAVLQDYSQKFNAITEGEQSGQISPARKKALSESLTSQTLANYPEYVDDIKKITGTFREMGGISSVLDLEKAAKDEDKQRTQVMSSTGLPVSLSDSPAYKDQMWKIHQRTVSVDAMVERQRKAESHAASMSAEARSAQTYAFKNEAIQAVTNQGSDFLSAMRTKADDLITSAQGDPEKIKLAQMEWNKVRGMYDQSITALGAHDPTSAGAWKDMGKTLDAYFQDGITGKPVTEAMSNKVKMIEYGTQAKLMSTPQGAAFFTAAKMAPTSVDKIISLVGMDSLKNIMETVTKGTGVNTLANPKLAEATREAYRGVTDIYDKSADATEKEAARTQGVNILSKSLNDLSAADIYGADPKAINQLMQQVDSRFFAEQVAAGNISPQALSNSTAVAARVYLNPLIKSVNEKFATPLSAPERFTVRTDTYLNPNEGQIGTKPSYSGSNKTVIPIDVLNISFVGGKILFEPKPNVKVVESDRRDLISSMKSSGDAISQLVRITAHTKGTTDYQKTWDEEKHKFFPGVFPDPVKLRAGQTVKGKNGKSYKYLGGDYNDIEHSYMELPDASGQ